MVQTGICAGSNGGLKQGPLKQTMDKARALYKLDGHSHISKNMVSFHRSYGAMQGCYLGTEPVVERSLNDFLNVCEVTWPAASASSKTWPEETYYSDQHWYFICNITNYSARIDIPEEELKMDNIAPSIQSFLKRIMNV